MKNKLSVLFLVMVFSFLNVNSRGSSDFWGIQNRRSASSGNERNFFGGWGRQNRLDSDSLYAAINMGDVDRVQNLVNGISAEELNSDNLKYPLAGYVVAAARTGSQASILRVLHGAGVDLKAKAKLDFLTSATALERMEASTPFEIACLFGYWDVALEIGRLRDFDGGIFYDRQLRESVLESLLNIRGDHQPSILELLPEGDIYRAIAEGDLDGIRAILENSDDVNDFDYNLAAVAIVSAQVGSGIKVLKLLRELGVDFGQKSKLDFLGATKESGLFTLACVHGYWLIALTLMRDFGCNAELFGRVYTESELNQIFWNRGNLR